MIEKIKEDFKKQSWEPPFSSSDYFSFFGYAKHTNFKRFLDKEKFYPHIFCDSYSKINVRERKTITFDRLLFIQLCKENNLFTKEIEDICFNYYSQSSKKRINFFCIRKKESFNDSLKIRNVPCGGKFYTYSLNTYNLAKDLLLCPYDIYKFCSIDLSGRFKYVAANVNDPYSEYSEKIPFYHFDHTNYQRRNEFLALLDMIIEKYKMSDLSKRLAETYYNDIKEMLFLQTRIDFLKKEKVENLRKENEKKQFQPSLSVKEMYRKACKLYHPDKNPKGEEIFKIINKAYQEGNIAILKKYSSIT